MNHLACNQCKFTTGVEKGLKIHMSRTHKHKVENTDSETETEMDENSLAVEVNDLQIQKEILSAEIDRLTLKYRQIEDAYNNLIEKIKAGIKLIGQTPDCKKRKRCLFCDFTSEYSILMDVHYIEQHEDQNKK